MLLGRCFNIAEAAASGQGLALLPVFLAEQEFARGRLVAVRSGFVETLDTFYLVWPKHRPMTTALRSLIDWLATGQTD